MVRMRCVADTTVATCIKIDNHKTTERLPVNIPSTSSPVSGPPRLSIRTPTLVVSSASSTASDSGTSCDRAATSSNVAVVAAPKEVVPAAPTPCPFKAGLSDRSGKSLLVGNLRLAGVDPVPPVPKAAQRSGTTERQEPKRQHAVSVQPAPSWDMEEHPLASLSLAPLLCGRWCIFPLLLGICSRRACLRFRQIYATMVATHDEISSDSGLHALACDFVRRGKMRPPASPSIGVRRL